jgi:hypothetical protein
LTCECLGLIIIDSNGLRYKKTNFKNLNRLSMDMKSKSNDGKAARADGAKLIRPTSISFIERQMPIQIGVKY